MDADLIASARIVYLEGYLFDRPEAKAAFRQAAEIAAKAGRQVALSLSDAFCVDRHRRRVPRAHPHIVDILFANEAEITSLYQTQSFDEAARHAQADTKLAALTRSEKGSVILGEGKSIAIPAAPVAKVVDTTGAGDLYAAGFLYGVATGRDLETSGRLGSLAAAEIISHIGARPEVSLRELARAKGHLPGCQRRDMMRLLAGIAPMQHEVRPSADGAHTPPGSTPGVMCARTTAERQISPLDAPRSRSCRLGPLRRMRRARCRVGRMFS